MRLRNLILAACAFATLGFAIPSTAEAGWHHRRAPAGWGEVRPVRHWVYRPRYHHQFHHDRYAYWYRQPRYYPAYNTGYWRPAREMCCGYRARYAIPRYYQAWGYPNPHVRVVRRHHRLW